MAMMMMMTIGILFSTMPAIAMPVGSPRCFPTIKPAIDSGKPPKIKIQLRMGTQTKIIARGLAGKPLAGFCTTPSRRITVVYGVMVHAIRSNNFLLHR